MQECENQTMEEDGKPGFIQYPDTSSPDLVEFERYLYFYKHTVDLLREHGIVSAEEVPLPVVSTAISHLWQELSEERRDSILQYCSQRDFHLGPTDACQEPACADGDVRDSGGNSEEASGSLVSTPEEVMFEDAFDVAAGFLETNETQGLSSQSSSFTSGISENSEDDHRLYLQITDFLKSLFFANTHFCQVSFPKGSLQKEQCISVTVRKRFLLLQTTVSRIIKIRAWGLLLQMSFCRSITHPWPLDSEHSGITLCFLLVPASLP
uniref:Stimulated by retinoic acid 8 n=1 Tax=Phasianus colchicus TaxID=9054 RepID=A0A669PXC9_PHACC